MIQSTAGLISDLNQENQEILKELLEKRTILGEIFTEYPEIKTRIEKWIKILNQSPGVGITLKSILAEEPKEE